MESLRGSSFTGQGFEDVVVRAMERMGFTVQSNKLLDNSTGEVANQELEQLWVQYILAKEWNKGNFEPWWQLYQRAPMDWELQLPRPFVTEVDVMAEIASPLQLQDRYCGFSVNGRQLSMRQFIEQMRGRSWLIEIPGPSGASVRKRDKATQLQWLQHLSHRRKCGEGVALFYNGTDPLAPPPVTYFPGCHMIVVMHFLPSIVQDLPENI
ncbi:unnamed protein product, partial [Symbiodinium pilosum]